jgi:hypothetical protein
MIVDENFIFMSPNFLTQFHEGIYKCQLGKWSENHITKDLHSYGRVLNNSETPVCVTSGSFSEGFAPEVYRTLIAFSAILRFSAFYLPLFLSLKASKLR